MSKKLLFPFFLAAALVTATHAASLTQVSWNFLDSDDGTAPEHKISLFTGSAKYEGVDATPAQTSGSIGDGTVLDYRFFKEDDGNLNTIVTALDGGGGRIAAVTTTDTSFSSSGETAFWTTTDPGASFATTPDYTGNSWVNGLTDLAGSIDISGLSSGTIYFTYGAYRTQPYFNLTMKDAQNIAPDFTNTTDPDFGDDDMANNTERYIVGISFVNDLGYDSIDFVFNTKGGGQGTGTNAHFSGIILDGVAAVPEPSSLALLGLGGLALTLRRRR